MTANSIGTELTMAGNPHNRMIDLGGGVATAICNAVLLPEQHDD